MTAPPSKSVAHRALICGALTDFSPVGGLAWSEDILATCDCLRTLGAKIYQSGKNSVLIGYKRLSIPGSGRFDAVPEGAVLPCRESGSTLRFLIPLAMLSGRTVTFTGSERLMQRPLGIYQEIAAKNGGLFEQKDGTLTVRGGLCAGDYEIPGNISSQFITGLLIALSLADGESRIRVTEPFESRSYTDITVAVMRDFGVPVQREGNTFVLAGNAAYQKRPYMVEGDCSNAAFLEALALLSEREDETGLTERSDAAEIAPAHTSAQAGLTVLGVPAETCQGDHVYYEMLHSLADGTCREFDLSDCPDLAPCLFAMAAYYGGAHFTGTARLAIKESDRAKAMAEELAKFGATVSVGENDVTVAAGKNYIAENGNTAAEGGNNAADGTNNTADGTNNVAFGANAAAKAATSLHAPAEVLSGHNDHRIVMALALLCTVTGGVIDGAEAVAKSYPDFFEVIGSAGITVSCDD